ncbi:MAG: hypothetical protein NTX15_02385 [Candidatus Kapabacteria bacterium]|nr:hypothetical protein [Candidatus Kapabacteria bacterium]
MLSTDEKWVAALTENDSVFVLRMPDLSILDKWSTGIPKRVNLEDRWIAIQPNGTRIAVSSFTATRTFERNGTVVANVGALSTSSNTCVDWTPAGDQIVASSEVEGHVLADATSGAAVRQLPAPSFYGFISPNGLYLASQAKNTQSVLIRSIATGATIGTIPSAPGLLPFGIAWYPDNTIVRNSGPSGGRLERFAVDGSIIDTITSQAFGFGSTTFNVDGTYIGGAAGGFSVVIRHTTAPKREQDVSDALWEIKAPVPVDTAVLTIPKVRTTTMQHIPVPIRLGPYWARALNGITTLDVDIAWNATMAVPQGSTPVGSITNGVRTITVRVPVDPIRDDVVADLDLGTALGNDSTTLLRIVNVRGAADPTLIKRMDGSLLLSDICRSGGARYVNGNGTATLRARYADGGFDVSLITIEDGIHSVLIVTPDGRVVYQHDASLHAGSHEIHCSAANVSDGVYYVVIRTPSITLSTIQQVVR